MISCFSSLTELDMQSRIHFTVPLIFLPVLFRGTVHWKVFFGEQKN